MPALWTRRDRSGSPLSDATGLVTDEALVLGRTPPESAGLVLGHRTHDCDAWSEVRFRAYHRAPSSFRVRCGWPPPAAGRSTGVHLFRRGSFSGIPYRVRDWIP